MKNYRLRWSIDPEKSHKGTEHAEACEGFELESVVSCGSGEQWWRTELGFGSRKSLDDHHRSTTFGAAPKVARVIGG